MNTILFIALKIILVLYLTEAIIIMWRCFKGTLIESWNIMRTKFYEEFLPTANGNFKLAFTVTIVISSIMLIPVILVIIGYSAWSGLKWPVVFIKAIREEN